jgi:predicted TIM-barrel fold metal-dependent hydrolase
MPDWAFTPLHVEDLLTEMDKAGVTRALLVPPAFNGGRNEYSLDAARRFPGRFGVVGRLNLSDPKAPELMEKWAEEEHGYGLRFAFFLPEQKALLADGSTEWLWPLAQRLNIPLMIFPTHDLLDYFGNLARKFDGLRLTLDHMAVGHTEHDRDDNAFPHIKKLIALAALPNVAVKASALPDYSTHPYPYRNLHSYLKQAIDAFGPERVFWGSDITRLACTYREAVTMFTEELSWLKGHELALVMDQGVRAWHGWTV